MSIIRIRLCPLAAGGPGSRLVVANVKELGKLSSSLFYLNHIEPLHSSA